jgi:hypothetical protein
MMGGGKSTRRIRGVAAQGWKCAPAGRVGRGWRRDSTEYGEEEMPTRGYGERRGWLSVSI